MCFACVGYLTELHRPEVIVVLAHFVPVGKLLHFMWSINLLYECQLSGRVIIVINGEGEKDRRFA